MQPFDAWLSADEAAAVSKHGCLHLRSYKRLAELSLHKREPRYPIHCKAHMLHHTFRILEQKCQALCWLDRRQLSDRRELCGDYF